MDEYSLYVHIPFCIGKCNYCDFVSFPGLEHVHDDYTKALIAEMKLYRDKRLRTVYIGGGTPTCMDSLYVARILRAIEHIFDISRCIEISIEANPDTLTEEMLSCLKENGVNRLSIGLQSWDAKELKMLGRLHNSEKFVNGYMLARDLDFDNINIDLMFGLPGQTMDSWRRTLREVTNLNPEHVSCYSLIVEKGTKLYTMLREHTLEAPDADIDRGMYRYGVKYLQAKGYTRYEISNFAKEGMECAHNLVYWDNRIPYIGVGVAAHSYDDGIRRWNTKDIYEYLDRLKKGLPATENCERLNPRERMFEAIFLGLRTSRGLNFQAFKRSFKKDIRVLFADQINDLIKYDLIETDEKSLRLTPMGIDLSNSVFIRFLKQ